jgi:hypothetical protein
LSARSAAACSGKDSSAPSRRSSSPERAAKTPARGWLARLSDTLPENQTTAGSLPRERKRATGASALSGTPAGTSSAGGYVVHREKASFAVEVRKRGLREDASVSPGHRLRMRAASASSAAALWSSQPGRGNGARAPPTTSANRGVFAHASGASAATNAAAAPSPRREKHHTRRSEVTATREGGAPPAPAPAPPPAPPAAATASSCASALSGSDTTPCPTGAPKHDRAGHAAAHAAVAPAGGGGGASPSSQPSSPPPAPRR